MGKLIVLLVLVLPFLVSAQAQVKANDQCLPGNYGYDWRTTRPPCDTTDESKKCRLNRPCYEEVNGARVAVGVCTAEKFCSTRSVRVCDGIECSWKTPELTEVPSQNTPAAGSVQTLQKGESLMESALQRILGNEPEPTSPAIEVAQSKVQDALERLAYSPENEMGENYDRYNEAVEELELAKRLHNNPAPSLRDYLRGIIAPRLTPADQLPDGEPASVQPQGRPWFNQVGSTFGDPYRVAELLAPPERLSPLDIAADAARQFDEGARSVWHTIPGLEPEQPPRTYTFDSIGSALVCGVFGYGCPEPTYPIRETQYTEADLEKMLQEELSRPIVPNVVPQPPAIPNDPSKIILPEIPTFPPIQPTPVVPTPQPIVPNPTPILPTVPVQPPTPSFTPAPTPPVPPAIPTVPSLPITTPIVSAQPFSFSWFSNFLGLLSSLLQWVRPQQPAVQQPTTLTQPILSVVAQPSRVRAGEKTRIAWASAQWKNSALVTCQVLQVGISLGTGGATGSVLSNPLSATTSATVYCFEPRNTSVQRSILIPVW